ncbi:hypothetical protein [Streptomyces axinellae]|uniref:Uncharacterized protein n=1 Tax=Streptomyces axinellae TaxID=552788 RepID=A0ABN3Q6R7_9ACTN
MAAEVLEDNGPTRGVLDLTLLAKPPALRLLPDAVWRAVRGAAGAGFGVLQPVKSGCCRRAAGWGRRGSGR